MLDLGDRPIVLDGGLSTALEQQGADLSGDLWTARLLGEEPERIAAAHRAFYEAGAQVATTASYQASVEGLVAAGYDAEQARGLLTRSVTVAREVRDELADDSSSERPGLLVAASVGPYGAFLADGSEYTGRYGVPASRLRDFHGPRLELLAAAGPDLLAVETIPDVDEAGVLVGLLDELGVPAWFSYAVSGGATNAGQPLEAAYAVLAGCRSLVAAGLNCSDQTEVLGAVQTAVAVTGLPAVAYPNRGGSWDAGAKAWAYGDSLDPELVPDWLDAGVRLLGGCCGNGPSDIARLAAAVTGAGDREGRPRLGDRRLVERADDVRHAVSGRLSAAGISGDLELTGASGLPGLLTKGDVDLHLRVSPARFPEVVNSLRELFRPDVPEAWGETLAVFAVDGQGTETGLAVTPAGSEHDVRFTRAWQRLRDEPALRRAYNAIKADPDALSRERAKAEFFGLITGT